MLEQIINVIKLQYISKYTLSMAKFVILLQLNYLESGCDNGARLHMVQLNTTVAEVTQRIIRAQQLIPCGLTLRQVREDHGNRPERGKLSCGNLAHGFAACGAEDKNSLRLMEASNIAIVTAYNDMLSAHQPYAVYPDKIKQAMREIGCTAQVAGGVPAMCDGVTQGQDGMELSLLSRDLDCSVHRAVAVAPDVRWCVGAGYLRQNCSWTIDGRAQLWLPASIVCAGGSDGVGSAE